MSKHVLLPYVPKHRAERAGWWAHRTAVQIGALTIGAGGTLAAVISSIPWGQM